MGRRNNVIYGDHNDEYLIVKEGEDLVVVHEHHFSYESAIIFTVGHRNTDWSSAMLLDEAKRVVDLMNGKK